jgi:hypothetical protein
MNTNLTVDEQYATRPFNEAGYVYSTYSTTPEPVRPATTEPAVRASSIDEMRYWVGVGLTALIAALGALVGLVLIHGVLHIPVVFQDGATTSVINTTAYAVAAAGIALFAGALFNGMLRVAPRPALYYAWIAGIVTILATLLPFATTAAMHSKIALGGLNLAVGILIALLIPLAAQHARR